MATIKSGDMFWSFSELKSSLPKNVQESMSAQGVVQKAKRLFAGKPEEQKVAIQTAIELGADIKGVESGFIEIESEAKKNGYDVAYSYDRNTRTIQTYLIPSESLADARTMTANKIAESFPVIASPIEVKGEISFHGMPGISRFYADETADNKMMLVTTQRKMLDAAIGALKGKRTQEALRQRNKQESESSIRAAQQRAMSSVNVAGNYVPVSQEGRQARSGTGTPMQKLVREATLQFDDYLSEIIRKNAKDLWRQNKERDSFYRYNAKLMQGMQLIANIFSYYPPDEAMEIIRKNPNLRIITESAAWKTGGIKAELRQLASLGFNAGLSGESSFSHYETSLIPKSYHAGGSFDQSSSRKRQQVAKYAELQAEAIRKRESSAKSRRGMLFSKEEIKAGVKPRGAEERTYGLIDVTQEEYAKVVRDLVAKGKIDKKYLYSGIGLDALAMSEDVREEFNSLLRHSGKVNKKEFSDYVSQLKAKNPKISDEKAQKQALATLLGIEEDFDIVGKRKSAGEDWRYEYTTPLDAKSGTKLLTKAGYGRSSTNFIDPLIIRAIMERRFGREISDDEFAKIGVQGVRAAGKIKAKEIPGKITEALSQVFSEVEEIDGTIDTTRVRAIEQIINRSPLRGYITYNESKGIFQTDGSKLREVAAGEAGEKQLASIIAAINDMGNAVGIGSLFDVSVVQDKDTGKDMRHYDMSKNFIARTAIRQIDETPYGAPGGAVFSADYRARGAMNRMIALSASGQNFGTFQNYMSEVMGQTPEQKKHLARMREDTQSAIENTLKTLRDDFVINPEDTTVGHGSQYKINLDDYAEIDDEIFDHMKNGIIDPEYFKKTSYYQIQEAMKNGAVYYDPQMFGGYFSEFDEKTGKTFGGSMAALGTFDVVSIVDPNNDAVGYKLNQNRLSAFRSMDFASQSARQTADEYDINRANAMAVKYYTDLQNDVQNKEGITFATDTKRRLLHSSMSKSAAGNYGEIALAREDLADALSRGDYKTAAEKSQIIKQLTTAVTFNPSDLLNLLSGQEQMVLSSETLQDALGNEYEQWSTHKVAETDEERAAALETYYQQLYGTDSSGFLEEERKWPEKGFEKAKAAIGADLKERIDKIKEAQKTIGNVGYYDESGVMHYIGFDSENNPIEVADEVDASAEAFAQLRINQANERAARLLKDAETFYDKNADKRDKDVSSNTWAQRILASHLVKSVTTGSAEYNKRMSSAAEDLEQGKGNGTIEGLFGWLFRFPLSSGLDDKATEIFADEGVSKGSARAGLGVWQELNGDNDGDKLATLMTFGDGKKIITALKNGDTKTLIDQARIVVQKQNRISSAVSMAKEREIKESESAKSGFSEKDLSALTKKEADRTGAILARYNKQKTGSLSNEYQGVAEAMTNLGIDEIGIGSDVSSQRSAANAMITRALFETTTQEAISSKKVADRIEAKYGNGALSDENSKFYHELDDLIKDLSKEDTFNKEENLRVLKSRMIEMGILGDGEDAFDSRISARILETIAEYSNGRAVLESIFGKDTVTDEFMDRIRRGEVNLSADQVFSAVSATNQRLSSIGGIGGAVRKKYSQVEGLSDASWNPAAALGKAIGENNPAFKKYNDTLKEIKNSVDAEAKSEQTKIGIAEKEAAAILKLAGVYGGLGETLDKVKLANEALNSANWNTDPVGITNLLQKQFGVTYEDRGFGRTVGSFGATGEVAVEGRRYKIAGFKQGDKIPGVESRKWVDENGKEITDQDLIARLNRMGYDEKDYKRLSKTFGAMDYGNIAHTTQEIVSTLGLRLPDFENISSYEDFRNIIEKRIQEFLNSKNKEERELGKYAQGLWTEQEVDGRGGGVDVHVQKYRDALQLIGKTGAEIEEAVRNFVNIGIHYSDIATQGGRKDLEILSEERVGVPVYDTSVNSAIDSLVYDPITGKVTYRDFKTKDGKVGGHELAQLYSYIFGDQAAALRIAGIEDETSDTIGRELDYNEFKNNIADAFGYTADKPMSQKRFNVLKKVISAARKRAEERAQRENVDTSGKAFKNILIDEIYSAFEGSIVRGSEEGGDSTYLDTAMLSRRVSGPLADVLKKITNREQISEEDEKTLEEHGYVGQGAYDRWGERPGSSYYKEKEEAAEQEAQEKSLKSDYIKLLKEQYDLLIKIDAVKEKMRRAEERGERTTGFEEDLKILQSAKRGISRQMHSDKFAGLADDEDIQNAEAVQKHRRKSKKATLGLGGAEEQLAYFEKYAERRIGLEAKIEDATIKAQTAQTTNERKAFENLKTIYEGHLSDTDEVFEKLKAIVEKEFPEQFKEINERMEEQRALLFAQKAASNRGNRTIFDVIKSDIQRATTRITDFGLAAKVLNTARKEIQQVYQNILKLDEAMTNLRIVTGSNTEQAKDMMNTYNDLAMQLGTTTQAVASSAAEWLRQGYSVSEANDLIKSSTYLSRLGFMDMSQSVTALTSVMKGFRIEASDSMDIVDKLTQLDAKYATTAGDIATALSRTSAVAREAGLDLDQTAAALTTMIDVSQQDASSVGNAFRTILARYGNVKATAFTSLVGDSEDIDDANGSINDTEKVLGAIGIKIRSSSSDMRDFDDAMDELADKWVTLTDVEKNLKQSSIMEQSIIANPLNCWNALRAA